MYEFNINGFVGAFPLWMLVKSPRHNMHTGFMDFEAIASIEVMQRISLVAFTDLALAEQFASGWQEFGFAGQLIRIDTPWAMVALVNQCSKLQYLVFDPTLGGDVHAPLSVDDARAAFWRSERACPD
jgi:hypothetical protein